MKRISFRAGTALVASITAAIFVACGSDPTPPEEQPPSSWSWEHPIPHGNRIYAIGGYTERDLWAVGARGNILTYLESIFDINWKPVKSPTTMDLYGVTGFGSDDAIAVGEAGTVIRWNGAEWSETPAPMTENLRAVWGVTPQRIAAVGDNGVVALFDGTNWTESVLAPGENFHAVWGVDKPLTLTAVGENGLIARYSGGAWSLPARFTASNLNGVWASNKPGDWFVAGDNGEVYHADTTAWVPMNIGTTANLTTIFGSDSAYVHTAGVADSIYFYEYYWESWGASPVVNLYGGWISPCPRPVIAPSPTVIHCPPAFFCGDGGMIVKAQFQELIVSTAHELAANLNDIAGTSMTSARAVGDAGSVFQLNGDTWAVEPSGVSVDIHGVWAAGANDYFAVGDGASIMRNTGGSWVTTIHPIGANLYGVDGINAQNAYCVGDGGAVLRFNGTNWTSLAGASGDLRDVWVAASNDAFAVGTGGAIVRANGAGVSTMTSPTGNDLRSVWGTAAGDVFAAGDNGTLLHFNGTSWTPVSVSVAGDFYRVRGTGGGQVVVVGDTDGVVLARYSGVWKSMQSPADNVLRSVWGNGIDSFYTVGNVASVLKFAPE